MKFLSILILILVPVFLGAARITSDQLKIGKPGSTGNKSIVIEGYNNKLQVDTTSGKWQFSNDGSSFKDIGSGGGSGGSGINLLSTLNGDCEAGDPPGNWSSTGGAFSAETTNPGNGGQSCSWNPSGSGEFLRTENVKFPDVLEAQKCTARIKYKWNSGLAGAIKWKVETDGDVLISEEKELDPSSVWREDLLAFSCPDNTENIRIEFESTADASTLLVDDVELGRTGIIQISAETTQWSTCETLSVNSGSLPTGGVSSNCVRFRRVGDVAEVQAWYQCASCTGGVNGSGSITLNLPSALQGLTLDTGVQTTHMGTGGVWSHLDGNGSYLGNTAVLGDRLWATQLTEKSDLPGLNLDSTTFVLNSSNIRFSGRWYIKVNEWAQYAKPQEAVNLETVGWHVDANIGGNNPNLTNAVVTQYTRIGDASIDLVLNDGSAEAEIPCESGTASTGLTCASANENVGVVFSIPTAGRYKACFEFSVNQVVGTSSSAETTFQIVETMNTNNTVLKEGNSRISVRSLGTSATSVNTMKPINLCGDFTWTSVGKKTLRLMFEQVTTGSVATNLVIADRQANLGQRDIHVTVQKMSEQFPTPVFTDLRDSLNSKVQSGTVQNTVIVYDEVTCQTTPTFENRSGAIDSVTRNTTGDCSINFTAGTFSSAPTCVGNTVTSAAAGSSRTVDIAATSPTQFRFLRWNTVGSVKEDGAIHFHCIGSK